MARDGQKGEQLIFGHWRLVVSRWQLAAGRNYRVFR
jgi:hypothetical protein